MTAEEQQEIDRICSQADDRIKELEAQLSSKEQDYNNCINLLRKERDENKSLRAENERLKKKNYFKRT